MEMTALEEFINQLEEKGNAWENVSIASIQISINVKDYLELKSQAKAKEKNQKITFANNYGFDICGYDYERAEQYYNTTFKSE